MNIEDVTIKQAREIAAIFARGPAPEAVDIAASMIGKYCIVRTYSAGVHAGIVTDRKQREVILSDSRRIWYWDGAASLSQLAKTGTSKPDQCKFAVQIDEILLTECIEIIPCTQVAEQGIRGVSEWTK